MQRNARRVPVSAAAQKRGDPPHVHVNGGTQADLALARPVRTNKNPHAHAAQTPQPGCEPFQGAAVKPEIFQEPLRHNSIRDPPVIGKARTTKKFPPQTQARQGPVIGVTNGEGTEIKPLAHNGRGHVENLGPGIGKRE